MEIICSSSRSCEATNAFAKKAQKKIWGFNGSKIDGMDRNFASRVPDVVPLVHITEITLHGCSEPMYKDFVFSRQEKLFFYVIVSPISL